MALKLQIINDLGWCKVFLIDLEELYIGANIFSNIKNRLIEYLQFEYETKLFDYNGYKVEYIFVLSEEHVGLYGTRPSEIGDIKIFFLEDGGKQLSEINLNKKIIKKWIKILERTKDIYEG